MEKSKQMKRIKEMRKWYPHAASDPHEREKCCNLQKHVLLVLLKDGADVLEDLWVKQVYTTVDNIAHKRAGLFHIMQNLNKKIIILKSHFQCLSKF